MYGTVARIKVKPGKFDDLMAWGQQADQSDPQGPGAMLVFRMDSDPNEVYMVIAAPSREAYRAESESEHRHQRYLEMLQFLDGEPEWHDGEVIEYRVNA